MSNYDLEVWITVLVLYWITVLAVWALFTLLWFAIAVIIDIYQWFDGYLDKKERQSSKNVSKKGKKRDKT